MGYLLQNTYVMGLSRNPTFYPIAYRQRQLSIVNCDPTETFILWPFLHACRLHVWTIIFFDLKKKRKEKRIELHNPEEFEGIG